jgi:hypothetical protein
MDLSGSDFQIDIFERLDSGEALADLGHAQEWFSHVAFCRAERARKKGETAARLDVTVGTPRSSRGVPT